MISAVSNSRADLQRARAAVEDKAIPGAPALFLKKELAAGCTGTAAAKLDEAIAQLVKEKRLLPLQRGRSVFYLHVAAIEPLLPGHLAQPKKAPRRRAARTATATVTLSPASERTDLPPPFQPARVHSAYRELARETGFSDVLISDLQRRSEAVLDALKPWLLQESRAGRALPTRGDWSIADGEARAAAIEIGGEPHLRVRLVGG